MKRFAMVLALGLVVALAATSALAAKPDKAGKGEGKAGRHDGVMGVVLKVENGSITVQGRGKKGTETTITTDANTKFVGVASAADIKPGMRVMATPATGTAQKVVVREGQGKDGGAGKGARKLKNK